jgi:hypothetical protein
LFGTILLFLALGIIFYLVLRSRKTIEYIHRKKLSSAREITKQIHEKR